MHAIAEPASVHLSARELRKGFGDGPILDGVSLTVTAGQRIAVIGENGSGKSTLLRLLAGAIEPDAGVVIHTTDRRLVEQELVPAGGSTVADLRADAIASASRATAELEAATAALSAGAARADDRYAAALARVERLDAWGAERRLARSLAAFDADFEVHRPLRELSVGQRYRLRLGCALADPAGTLLLDEPSNHLDEASLDRLTALLVDHAGITVIVTHDRWLLDAVATALFDLDPVAGRAGTLFTGTFARYRARRAAQLAAWRNRYAGSLASGADLEARIATSRRRS